MTIESSVIGDRQLISEVSARNIEAFGEFHDRYRDRAYRLACSVYRDDGRARTSCKMRSPQSAGTQQATGPGAARSARDS